MSRALRGSAENGVKAVAHSCRGVKLVSEAETLKTLAEPHIFPKIAGTDADIDRAAVVAHSDDVPCRACAPLVGRLFNELLNLAMKKGRGSSLTKPHFHISLVGRGYLQKYLAKHGVTL